MQCKRSAILSSGGIGDQTVSVHVADHRWDRCSMCSGELVTSHVCVESGMYLGSGGSVSVGAPLLDRAAVVLLDLLAALLVSSRNIFSRSATLTIIMSEPVALRARRAPRPARSSAAGSPCMPRAGARARVCRSPARTRWLSHIYATNRYSRVPVTLVTLYSCTVRVARSTDWANMILRDKSKNI